MNKQMMTIPLMTALFFHQPIRSYLPLLSVHNTTSILTDSIPKNKMTFTVPASITFDWEVIQESSGDEETGAFTYYFTTNGDYAAAKKQQKGEDGNDFIIYDKGGAMLMFNENKKTITIMKLLRPLGEGAQMGKDVAEKISKKPLRKDATENMAITKTGKTKTICGFSADEYVIKNEGGVASAWYANVSFDPIRIYTMGAGRPADISKLKNDPKMQNNMAAIPILNKNYLMAEIEAGGKKGLQTKSITKKTTTIATAGYKIIDMSNKGIKEMTRDRED